MNQCRGQEYPSKSGKATVLLKLLGPKTLKIFHPENAQRSVKVKSKWQSIWVRIEVVVTIFVAYYDSVMQISSTILFSRYSVSYIDQRYDSIFEYS